MIGIDTLQVNLAGFDVLPGHAMTVRPSPYLPSTGEVIGDYVLWEGQHGASGFFNDSGGRFFVDVRPKGGRVGCSVHLSVPKYATGGRHNLNLVDGEVTREVLTDLGKQLEAIGIRTNLLNAGLSRVDLTRNVQGDEPFSVYRPVLSLIEGKRMKDRREYVDGFLFGNTAQQVCVYDKVAQLEAMRTPVAGLRNVLRFEYRARDGRTAKNIGFNDVGSLLKNYGEVPGVYRAKLREHVFRFRPDGLEVLSAKVLEDELTRFAECAGRNWFAKWVESYGVREITKLAEVDTVAKVVQEVTGDRNKAWRVARKLKEATVNVRFIQRDPSSRKSYRTLYAELCSKVLAA